MIEDRLTNWGVALRAHRRQGHALSFEGNYRSPQCWEPRLPAASSLIDYPDAWRIEAAWQTLPNLERITLRAHYCLLWSPSHIRRILRKILGRAPIDLTQTLASGASLIELALCRTERENKYLVRISVRIALDITQPLAYIH